MILEATEAQLFGPWSPVPFGLPRALLATVDKACRADNVPFPAGLSISVVDVRGKGLVQVYYSAPNGNMASCIDVTIDASGNAQPLGGGGAGSGPPPKPLGILDLEITDQVSHGSVRHPPIVATYLAGRMGPGIATVQLAAPDGVVARASSGKGWFAVWIQGDLPAGWFLRGLDATGTEVAKLAGT